MTRHTWTEEDEQELMEAVEYCAPNRELVSGPREVFWAMVVGKSGLKVTPGAARTRWEQLKKNISDTNGGWKITAKQVEDYERGLQERTWDAVEEIRGMVLDLRNDVANLSALWK